MHPYANVHLALEGMRVRALQAVHGSPRSDDGADADAWGLPSRRALSHAAGTCLQGSDTSAISLQILVLMLAAFPGAQRRAQAEVDAVVGEDARELHGLLDTPRRLVREDILQPFRSGHTNK